MHNAPLPDMPFIEAAMIYIEYGWHVFPLVPKSKAPLTRNGFKDASNDPEQIEVWWKKNPNANIGIATGKISGLVVVDIDGEYPSHWPKLTNTLTVKTSKGLHYYFKYPNNEDIKCRTKVDGYDVDIRADGGYIVAPPSIHPNGVRYEFIDQ